MRTFLNVPILDINCTYQMLAHRSCVIPILNKFRTFNSTVQVLELIWMLNELIQANEMVFMNFWYIEHYGASLGDDIDAKMNNFKHIKWLFNVYRV